VASRRHFLMSAVGMATDVLTRGAWAAGAWFDPSPKFPGKDAKWKRSWDQATSTLAGNTRTLGTYPHPVLIEGPGYPGIWMECGPTEALVNLRCKAYLPQAQREVADKVAIASHMAFFELQRPDGQIPAYVRDHRVGFGQIQMVVPIAATAWEASQITKNEQLLESAHRACGRWDQWLRRYRNTRKTGLVEGFCTYDTGQDNSPRWAGMPNQCPDGDARILPDGKGLPRLSPDLSATTYGGRVALAAMAKALGKNSEADRWLEDADALRRLILERLYSPEDGAFYDLDTENKFVRVRSCVIMCVLGEHVLKLDVASDRTIFDTVWNKQLHNENAFWSPYPFPSIALNDPTFVRPIMPNSWGGPSQALTALRAPRWMPYYGKRKEMEHLMRQWISAIADSGVDFQQMDPVTGEFTLKRSAGGYSPTALVYIDFTRRLGGEKNLS
jgi:Trehalase